MDEMIRLIATNGVSTVILAFILYFFIQPVVKSWINNIDTQTKVLHDIHTSIQLMNKDMEAVKEDIVEIKRDIDKFIKS